MNLEELKKDEKLLQILSIDTLKTRHSDSLDFHELSVHQLVDAIEYAYEAGFNIGETSAIRQHTLQDYYVDKDSRS